MSFQKHPSKSIIKKLPNKTKPNKIKTKSVSLKDFIFTPTKICENDKKHTEKIKIIEFRNYIVEMVESYVKEDINAKQKKKIGDVLNSLIILRDRLQSIDDLYDTSDVFIE